MKSVLSRGNRLCQNYLRQSQILNSNRRALSSDSFYKAGTPPEASANTSSGDDPDLIMITPTILQNSIDIHKLRPGETIEIPYELTLTTSFRDFWQSSFYCHDRINTSTTFSRNLGLQDQVMPFSLMLYLTGSMSHADQAKVITEYKNARYHWPAFAGDTVHKKFVIRSLSSTSDDLSSRITIECILKNQRGVTLFTFDKTMLFPKVKI